MAFYKFTCCGEEIFLAEEHTPIICVEHNCGGVPCLAQAIHTGAPEGGAAEETLVPDTNAPDPDSAPAVVVAVDAPPAE
jgi:hypothetical protein